MDVFQLRQRLIDDYKRYSESFIKIEDPHIRDKVNEELESGELWPSPLVQLNPGFEHGAWISQLVAQGRLHPQTNAIFRLDKTEDDDGRPMRLHQHQSEAAVVAAPTGESYVLTTGTGSGKSLAYIVPIVNHVLRKGSGRGIQAVIVYPMNALANSQINELDKFLKLGFATPPVTYRRYTGQEGSAERNEIIQNPPDILLTNYVMLELLLTRPGERRLVEAMRGLQFLVLDELHTYRGRQGADVALLVRRVRDVAQNDKLQCVGTSATLAGGGTFAEQQQEIAAVASELFGSPVTPERVISETLRRLTAPLDPADADFVARLTARVADPAQNPPGDYESFIADPLSIWIENTLGLAEEEGSGRLKRAEPISIEGEGGAAHKLHKLTGVAVEQCDVAIRRALLAGYEIKQPELNAPAFAFRLHQFISRGDTVLASLEAPEDRYVTLNGLLVVPGDRRRALFPVCFCRECGQDYYTVMRVVDEQTKGQRFEPRGLRESAADKGHTAGYLYYNPLKPWPANGQTNIQVAIEADRLPDDWLEMSKSGWRVKSDFRSRLPTSVTVDPLGEVGSDGLAFQFIAAPFAFCLNCGVTYSGRMSDVSKLATLSMEGRSTATTILGLSTLRALRRDPELSETARKLLSFTDNRQDASLQAGHFNDFVEVGLVRAALHRALQKAGPDGIRHEELARKVFEALDLPPELYAINPGGGRSASRLAAEALRDVLGYRIYHDLRRGWRINAPNLEQCDLLRIEYLDLEDICADEAVWAGRHETLAAATPEQRLRVCQVLLDVIRRGLAIDVSYLESNYQDGLKQRSVQNLIIPWIIDESERMTHNYIAIPGPKRARGSGEYLPVSSRSGFGSFLRRRSTFPNAEGNKLKLEHTDLIIRDLFDVLAKEGLLSREEEPRDENDVPGYQLNAALMVWRAGEGVQPYHDPIRVPRLPDDEQAAPPNPFFKEFYTSIALDLKGIEAREHTAQVPGDIREAREQAFRAAQLPLLFCSPTMELGVDIAQLNAVNMRNVPPTPANYAQRSGRAGRSGQPALVFTYCATGSPHDQYFFKRPSRMVAGAVRPPRLDLTNEDLLRAHVHAVWLAEVSDATGFKLGDSLRDLLELADESPGLPIKPELRQALDSQRARDAAERRARHILGSIESQLWQAAWYTDEWLHQTVGQAVARLDEACGRWRGLYLSALTTRDRQDEIVRSPNSAAREKEQAKRVRAEAEAQLKLLLNDTNQAYSDFYSYRYFAGEGFLPGYSFPRLPLSAFIEGRRGRRQGSEGEYLSRPRFLAISEFGPRSVIYHEGSRYVINKAILPVTDDDLLTTRAKVCEVCGYLHPLSDAADPERCDNCDAPLPPPMRSLLRMQNVTTQRRDRINSDEEERVRMGYDLQTSIRYAERDGRPDFAVATVAGDDGRRLLTLTYGSAATIWRINKGWRRSKDGPKGFLLDIDNGYWGKSQDEDETDAADPMGGRKQYVIPFVEDRRNCLLLKFEGTLDMKVMASLQPALKNAVQVLYQLEDNELAVEPLPSAKERTSILLYESAEGGAGVLRRLAGDAEAIRAVARQALELCHFDPDTLEDRRRAERAREDCETACYDCLMSYNNQPDHRLLDRHLIMSILFEVAHGTVDASPTYLERDELLAQLKAACESGLEREWLEFLQQHKLNLPDSAQKVIDGCRTRSDFYYRRRGVAVYIDGPDHDSDLARRRDEEVTDCLQDDLGLTVLRFRYDRRDEWLELCVEHAHVFGKAGA